MATSQLMIFTNIPKDTVVAHRQAEKIAEELEEFSKFNIKPIVIVEPDSEWGLIDFTELTSGFYDQWIEDFFVKLKDQGITTEKMGTWTPFPEANLPLWNNQNTTPKTYSDVVNKYLSILKKHYPDVKTSILLNSTTYETDDYNWAEGEYVSLASYVEGIEPGLVDSFGMQGFPWIPAAGTEGENILDAREFLAPHLIKEAANILGVKSIWFNTGTFAAKYALDESTQVLVPYEMRKKLLNDVLTISENLNKEGYIASVNIFAEDKSMTAEGTDWSYWGSEYTGNRGHEVSIIDFLKDAYKAGVEVTFFLK